MAVEVTCFLKIMLSDSHQDGILGQLIEEAFREECLKNFDTDNYYGPNDDFPFDKIRVDKATRDQLNENDLKYLEQMGVIL